MPAGAIAGEILLRRLLDGFQLEAAKLERFAPGHRVADAVVPTARVLVPLAGGIAYRIDGRALALRPGRLLLVHAGSRRSWRADAEQGVELAWIEFASRAPASPASWHLADGDAQLERASCARLVADHQDMRPAARAAAELAARALLARCCAGLLAAAPPPPRLRGGVESAIAWIEAHLGERDPLAGVRRASGLGEVALRRALRAALGASPRAYVRAARMRRARLLLQRPGASVGAVAAEVGFADPFHFSRRYRAHWGRPPSADLGVAP